MQSTRTDKSLDAADLKMRGRFPYYQWMQREGIPIHLDVAGLLDVTALERKPWARTGKGLGAFLELLGAFQAERGMFVCEILPGEALDVQHHLYEQFTLILQGQGGTEIWQKGGPKRTFEWGKGSLFAPPKNTYYRMFNLSKEPVIYFAVTNAARVFNAMFGADTRFDAAPGLFEFMFNCDYDFLYHGWKMDVHGNVLDTPCEPADSRMKYHVKHAAYPVVEGGDVVWTYLGPRDKQPPFPTFWWATLPPDQRCVGKIDYACNYLQGMEGTTDSAHGPVLHAGFFLMDWTDEQVRQANVGFGLDIRPGYEMEDTAYGFRYASSQPDPRDPQEHKLVRVTPVVLPFGIWLQDVPHMFVPADDEHTWLYDVRTTSGGPVDREAALAERGERVGIDVGPDHRKFRTLEKNYLQDRQAMRERREKWSYTGIPWGKPHQDMLVTESMGAVYHRQGEHLGIHDVMVIRLRERMLAAVRRFMESGEAPAVDPSIRWTGIRGETRRLPIDTPWHAVELYADEVDLPGGVR